MFRLVAIVVSAGVIERPAHVLELFNQVQHAQPESFHINPESFLVSAVAIVAGRCDRDVLEPVNQVQPESFHMSLSAAAVRLVEAAFQGFERGHPFARECLHSMTCLCLAVPLLLCDLAVALVWLCCAPNVALKACRVT